MTNNQITPTSKSLVPTKEDLYADKALTLKQNELNMVLNADPKPEWIKENKFAGNTRYLPIGIVEYILTSIFVKWRLEVKTVQVIANSVQVTVRLHVLDPITGEWDWQDGVGASPIQTKAGAAATDFTQVTTSAVQMAAPAAESYALKDAAEKFGKIFGKDLGRKDDMTANYAPMMEKRSNSLSDIPEELILVIGDTGDKGKLTEIYRANPEYHSNPRFMQLLNERKNQLNGVINA